MVLEIIMLCIWGLSILTFALSFIGLVAIIVKDVFYKPNFD